MDVSKVWMQGFLLSAWLWLLWLAQPLGALRCYTTSYDIKNWAPCAEYEYGKSSWHDRCIHDGALPLCSSMRISSGCPDFGILPCQFDWKGAFGNPPPGTPFQIPVELREANLPYGQQQRGDSFCSHDYTGVAGLAMDFNVCERQTSANAGCFKTVTEVYKSGSIHHWTVVKGCGGCSWQTSLTSACESADCLDHLDQSTCACTQKSHDELIRRTCYNCADDMCNLATRRAAHHLAMMIFGTLFFSLLIRKCSA